MNGREFLGTAKFLEKESTDEASQRTAISRAYYACFLTTRGIVFRKARQKALRSYHIHKEKQIRHDLLIFMLKASSKDDVRNLGEDLGDMLGQRQKADYDMHDNRIHAKMRDVIKDAEYYLQQIDSMSGSDIGGEASNYIEKILSSRS